MAHDRIVIVNAYRTAIGNFNGSLSSLPAHVLGQHVIAKLIEEANIDKKDVSEVILGQILTAACGQNPARQASMLAGLPKEVISWNVNQVCGSGLWAVALGYQSIISGNSSIVIAGGQENMSIAPHAMFLRNGVKMGNAGMEDTMIKDGLTDAYSKLHMGMTAEAVAQKYSISRQQQDEFALSSQQKASKAQKAGSFEAEVVPVTVPNKKGDTIFKIDEFIRHDASIEALSALRAAFQKDGTVTAGSASGINDGAAAVMLMKESEAKRRGLKPMAFIVSFANAGVEPEIMGIGPVPASNEALRRAGWHHKDLDLIEANEAFASQAVAVNKAMGWDENKVNVNGGAIALGHPIGASGARILVTLLHEMKRRKAKKGLATLCIGGGMGVAMCIESI